MTSIVVPVPNGGTTGSVAVAVSGVNSNGTNFTVLSTPAITSLTPAAAAPTANVTIAGTNFGANQGDGTIRFNGTAATPTSWTDTSIVVPVPGGATSGNVVVHASGVNTNGVGFTVEQLAVRDCCTGAVGTIVTITGTGFGATQGSSTAAFHGVPATVNSWTDTQVVAVVPPQTLTGTISVTVGSIGTAWSSASFMIGSTVQVTDSLGNISSYTSAAIGGVWNHLSSTGSGCSSCTIRGLSQNSFDDIGNVLSQSDELSRKTFYTYDADGNTVSATKNLDINTPVTTSYTYNSFGEPLTVTDPLGGVNHTTTNTYDANGNLKSVTSPSPDGTAPASVTQFGYDPKGQLNLITDPLGHQTTLAYYPTGLIHTITDAQSNVTSYEYDSRGNRTAVVDAQQNRTTFTYDLGNRLTKITYPDTTFSSFGYDTRGRRTSVTDQNGKVTSYAYDDADRLTSVTDAAQNVTTYAYDLENNLTSITDAAQHTTSFVYDAFGRVTQTVFPSTLTENYVYDAVGNLTSKVDRKNQTILYVYDALNRLTHKGYPDATGVDYVYDLAGKIKQVTDPTGSYGFAYDNMGRMIGTTTQYLFLPGSPAPTFSNSYAYDASSNRTSFTAPDGNTNMYAYDTLNRLTTLTDSGAGQLRSVTTHSAVERSFKAQRNHHQLRI